MRPLLRRERYDRRVSAGEGRAAAGEPFVARGSVVLVEVDVGVYASRGDVGAFRVEDGFGCAVQGGGGDGVDEAVFDADGEVGR